jgi:hypothetical protein
MESQLSLSPSDSAPKTPLMKKLLHLMLVTTIFLPLGLRAAAAENFSGEWADKNYRGNAVFQLSVEQSGSNISIVFSANRTDGSGAAPEGDGKGKIAAGAVQFTWSDSFGNYGTGTIKKSGADVTISIKAIQVADSRCLVFYGDNIRLKAAGKK